MLGLTGKEICPVKALLSYVLVRGAQPSSLFITADNHYLNPTSFQINIIFSDKTNWTPHKMVQYPQFPNMGSYVL